MKKKILIINEFVFAGGIESVMHNFAEYLCRAGYDVTIFTQFREKDFYSAYPKNIKYKYYYRFRFKKYNLFSRIVNKFIRAVKGIMFLKRYDCVVAMKEGNSTITALNFKKVKKKIAWIHTDYNSLRWTRSIFGSDEAERKILSLFDHTVCVTKAVQDSLIATIGDPGNTIVKYNPVDIERIKRLSEEKCDLQKTVGKKLFVTVGRIEEVKGYVELVDSISSMRDKNFELWIIGGGEDNYGGRSEYYKKLKDKIAYNGLSDVVKLLGRKENPYTYLKQADFFICSSKSESFNLAVQESLVLGVPVITTNCPGVVELLDAEVCIVVNEIQQISEVIQKAVEDKYCFNVSNYNYFSVDECCKEIEKIL